MISLDAIGDVTALAVLISSLHNEKKMFVHFLNLLNATNVVYKSVSYTTLMVSVVVGVVTDLVLNSSLNMNNGHKKMILIERQTLNNNIILIITGSLTELNPSM